jgi:DNA-binding PadR family transcriptional regulator
MLARLQQEGLVDSEWEDARPDAAGRPPRKYYRLTAEGARVARLELAQAPAARGRTRHVAARPAHVTHGNGLDTDGGPVTQRRLAFWCGEPC